MIYYSGASKFDYDNTKEIDKIKPEIREIHCFEQIDNNYGLEQAVGWAIRRAQQDRSVPVVIEITQPEDFQRKNYRPYPIFIGTLKPKNHVVHNIDDLPISEVYKQRARELTDKFKEEE